MLRTVFGGLGGLLVLALGLAISSACYDVADQTYGNPTGLVRSNIPGEAGSVSTGCNTSSLKFDSGTSCPSFEHDIFPYMNASWACTSAGCHGGTTAPKLDPNSADTSLTSLRGTQVSGKPYVPSGTGGTGSSLSSSTSMLCNVEGSCGHKMPEAPGKDLTSDELCILQAWIECGGPK